jgi:hypothetical protein
MLPTPAERTYSGNRVVNAGVKRANLDTLAKKTRSMQLVHASRAMDRVVGRHRLVGELLRGSQARGRRWRTLDGCSLGRRELDLARLPYLCCRCDGLQLVQVGIHRLHADAGEDVCVVLLQDGRPAQGA